MYRTFSICLVLAVLAWHSYSQAVTSFQGTVTMSDGSVLPGMVVTLVNRDTNEQRSTTTDEQGRYSFPNVPPGRYRIVVSASGFKPLTREVDASLGQSKIVNFQLGGSAAEPATLRVAVADRNGGAIANAVIRITNRATDERVEASTDTNGEYRSEDLPPGDYTIEVEAPGYEVKRKRTSLKAGKTRTIRIRLGKID